MTDLFDAASEDGVTSADVSGIADESRLEALIDGTVPLVLVGFTRPL